MKSHRCNIELITLIAKRIKQLRKEKNISQDNFFIDTDIHIARIESGKTNITVSTLDDICKYLSISMSEFFADIDK
ncbi:MAG: helix-turn-helix domain-containing protein [Prevotellaceae bacterium]|jgi:transcriptional regulator with XRE-family HTH domain|nr:helix-turn-helix domain-containing protein [Prevotellaceae bacterium]